MCNEKKSYIKGMREREAVSFYHLLSRSIAHISEHYGTEKEIRKMETYETAQ
jgi:hypothetical protein